MLTAAAAREIFDYDPATGVLSWKDGRVINRKHQRGYILVHMNGRGYLAHRIIWLMVRGEWPEALIDHINGVPSDNRTINLRAATIAQNAANRRAQKSRSLPLKGITKSRNRWRAGIRMNGTYRFLGTFDSPEEAHAAYAAKAREVFGEFAKFT